jgi:hypothetical protein
VRGLACDRERDVAACRFFGESKLLDWRFSASPGIGILEIDLQRANLHESAICARQSAISTTHFVIAW